MLSAWLFCVLLVISLPWANFDGVAHWKNVQWVPFTHLNLHPEVMIETALNLLAFVPVGYLAIRSFAPHRRACFYTVLLGFVASSGIEAYQLFCHGRVPSTSDIIMNVAGTGIGIWLACAIDHMLTVFAVQVRRFTA